jgi:hypothetical protein
MPMGAKERWKIQTTCHRASSISWWWGWGKERWDNCFWPTKRKKEKTERNRKKQKKKQKKKTEKKNRKKKQKKTTLFRNRKNQSTQR